MCLISVVVDVAVVRIQICSCNKSHIHWTQARSSHRDRTCLAFKCVRNLFVGNFLPLHTFLINFLFCFFALAHVDFFRSYNVSETFFIHPSIAAYLMSHFVVLRVLLELCVLCAFAKLSHRRAKSCRIGSLAAKELLGGLAVNNSSS